MAQISSSYLVSFFKFPSSWFRCTDIVKGCAINLSQYRVGGGGRVRQGGAEYGGRGAEYRGGAPSTARGGPSTAGGGEYREGGAARRLGPS